MSDFHEGSRHVGRDPTSGTHRNEHSPMLGKRMGREGGVGGSFGVLSVLGEAL